MSVLQLFTNNAISLLESTLQTSDTSIYLQAGTGSSFPQPTNPGEFFLVTLESVSNPFAREIIRISGRTGDVLTIDTNGRGQEGTTIETWVGGGETLVDHRVTAETMRQAFLQPSANTGPQGIQGPAGPQGPQGIQGPAGPAGSGGSGGSIAGSNDTAVAIDPSWTLTVNTPVVYTNLKRGHKFWVTIVDSSSGNAETFEILAVVQGLLGSNSETVTWTQTNRIGYKFKGSVNLTLDTAASALSLAWMNSEATVTVTVTVAHLSL